MDGDSKRFVCTATGSDFSPNASGKLERLLDGTLDAFDRRPDQSFRWTSEARPWFCPADGEALREVDGVLQCDSCDRVIPGRLVYELIEFNAH